MSDTGIDWEAQAKNQEKPTIQLPQLGRSIGSFAEAVGQFMGKKNVLFYRPADRSVVRLEIKPVNKKETRVLQFLPVKNTEFITLLDRYMTPGMLHVNEETGETKFREKSVSPGHADATLASDQFRLQMPVIERIFNVPMPHLVDGKFVFPKFGYDPVLLSWLPPDAPKIDESMTLDKAKEILESILCDFCFVGVRDKINALAAMLTPMCRGMYSNEAARVPLVFYEANRPRAGKDYLAGIVGIIYEGCAVEDPPIATEKETRDDEFRKKILSTLRSGRRRIHSSNNKGFINSPALESLVTAQWWDDRILGKNDTYRGPNTIETSISCNSGTTYTPDFAARCLFIRLFFGDEDPNKRTFKQPDLHGWVLEHRSEVVSALYALIKNWVDHGMPAGSVPFTSFPEWARVVGGIMETAELGNPCVPNSNGHEVGGDKDEQDMRSLFELAYEEWGEGKWIAKKEIVAKILANDEKNDFSGLFGYLGWGVDEASARMRFGKLFDTYKGREFNGIRLDFKDADRASRNLYCFTKGEKLRQSQPTLAALAALAGKTTSPPNLAGNENIKGISENMPNMPKLPSKNPEIAQTQGITQNNHAKAAIKPQNDNASTWTLTTINESILDLIRQAEQGARLETSEGPWAFLYHCDLLRFAPREEIDQVMNNLLQIGEITQPRQGVFTLPRHEEVE